MRDLTGYVRRVCRACDGDGYLMADASTPENERLTRDSRVCTYCRGYGFTLSREEVSKGLSRVRLDAARRAIAALEPGEYEELLAEMIEKARAKVSRG